MLGSFESAGGELIEIFETEKLKFVPEQKHFYFLVRQNGSYPQSLQEASLYIFAFYSF